MDPQAVGIRGERKEHTNAECVRKKDGRRFRGSVCLLMVRQEGEWQNRAEQKRTQMVSSCCAVGESIGARAECKPFYLFLGHRLPSSRGAWPRRTAEDTQNHFFSSLSFPPFLMNRRGPQKLSDKQTMRIYPSTQPPGLNGRPENTRKMDCTNTEGKTGEDGKKTARLCEAEAAFSLFFLVACFPPFSVPLSRFFLDFICK
mmetsp:Transcript_13847/g.27583  ORF Transcript_13847/g.27583 Transcript_13847/m.27583 type:complete len:201 (-) Transcript_13847:1826-2428(-)